MSYQYAENPAVPSEAQVTSTFVDAMARVYLWMTVGLLITAMVATAAIQVEGISQIIFGSRVAFFGLIIAQFGLVIFLSAAIQKVSPGVALGLFFLYSGLTGLTLSVIFVAYSLGTIGLAFGITTAVFGTMTVLGWTIKKDLTKLGPILMISLFGLIIASVANWFLQSSALDYIISYIGVLLFMGLTVYQTRHIKGMTFTALMEGDQIAVTRIGILGALGLYLSFINMFLFILRIVGGRR